MEKKWYTKSRRRLLLDFHIDSWNGEFLSRYDPEMLADSAQKAGITAVTFFANTHTGLTNYPTQVGQMHPNLKGRDIFGETLDCLHRRGLDAVVYYCFIYVADYWNKHPEARVTDAAGNARKLTTCYPGGPKRFATCCFNDPGYRQFSYEQVKEICEGYDFEGVWPDMVFWPTVCYCDHCRRRYLEETGREMPRTVNWKDPEFVRLIRIRQRWLREYMEEITGLFKRLKPGVSVAHQSQTFTWDWMAGASAELAEHTDWMSADLYCDKYGLSYSGKIFYALSKEKPFERINCWNWPDIHEHVITRTADEMRQIAFSTIMNDGALVVIDQVDPSGDIRIHSRNYEMLKTVFGDIEPYEPFLGGKFRQDVGLYYSLNSNFDQSQNGMPVKETGMIGGVEARAEQASNTHQKCADSAARTLLAHHVPYGVVTKRNLGHLQDYRVLVLPNVAMLDEQELEAIRTFVREGGALYASRDTSTISGEGVYNASFLLGDLFGAQYGGLTEERVTYVSPTEAGRELYPEVFSADFPLTVRDWQAVLRDVEEQAEVLGTLTLPHKYPREDRHASIITDPPGRFTDRPALLLHRYGKGRVVYSSAALELGEHDSQREVFYRIVKKLACGYFSVETDAHKCVEITCFDQPEKGRVILHLLNAQLELPSLPIHNITISIICKAARAFLLPSGEELACSVDGDRVRIRLPELRDYAMICLE